MSIDTLLCHLSTTVRTAMRADNGALSARIEDQNPLLVRGSVQ
jgi:hypothetical protein